MEALAIRPEEQSFMPVMSIEQAGARYNAIVEYVSKQLRENTDFGVIPGTNTKKVLLKPGAEKLCTLFGLSKRFHIVERLEDWDGKEHGGEPFFNYIYRCALYRGDMLIAEADGSCNSRESKYRWRKKERTCPGCGVEGSVIKGKAQYGGGFLCWGKKGGCGAKFGETDERITSQVVERVPNPDIADQVNTMQKMGQKRALIAATLLAVNASDFFTQDLDLEDFTDTAEANGHEAEKKPERNVTPKKQTNAGELTALKKTAVDICQLLNKAGDELTWSAKRLNEFAVKEYGAKADTLELEPMRELVQKLKLRLDDLNKKQPAKEPEDREAAERADAISRIKKANEEQGWDDGDLARYVTQKWETDLDTAPLDLLNDIYEALRTEKDVEF